MIIPEATELSAGMTNDLEIAITHGSTCVRVGTALLGTREPSLAVIHVSGSRR